MPKKKDYSIYCIDCGDTVFGTTKLDVPPAECPINPAHNISTDSKSLAGEYALDNLEATADPTVDDDIDDGYASGESRWINTTTNTEFLCMDNTTANAVWNEVRMDVFGENYTYAESLSVSSTTNNNYQQKLKLTTTTLPAGTYRIAWNFELKSAHVNKKIEARVQLDDTDDLFETTNFYYQYYLSISGFRNVVLTADTHEIDIDYRDAGATTCFISGVVIEIWRIS